MRITRVIVSAAHHRPAWSLGPRSGPEAGADRFASVARVLAIGVMLVGSALTVAGASGSAADQPEPDPVTDRVAQPGSGEEDSSFVPPEQMPESADVLRRFVESAGGREALERHRSRRISGTIRNDEAGFRARVTYQQERPDKIRLDMFIPGAGTQVVVWDGEIGWEKSPDGAHRLLSGGRLRDIRTSASFESELGWESFLTEHETVGYIQLNGEPCVRIQANTVTDRKMFLLFSMETGLLRGRQTYQSIGGGGDVLQLVAIDNYQEFEGVMLPMRIVQRTVQGDTIIEYSKYEINPEESADFTRPEEVQTLLSARGEDPDEDADSDEDR